MTPATLHRFALPWVKGDAYTERTLRSMKPTERARVRDDLAEIRRDCRSIGYVTGIGEVAAYTLALAIMAKLRTCRY